jgi:hypothetical protein
MSEKIKCKYPKCRKFCNSNDKCCKLHINHINTFEKPEECPICIEPFQDNLPLFPCSHWICKECVIKSGKNECPVCRTEVEFDSNLKKRMQISIKKRKKEMKQEQENNDRQFAQMLQNQLQNVTQTYLIRNGNTLNLNLDETRNLLHNILGNENIPLEDLIANAIYTQFNQFVVNVEIENSDTETETEEEELLENEN